MPSLQPAVEMAPLAAEGTPPALTARGLGFAVGGTPIVNGVDLDLPRGRLTVLMGPNGAGKSVLLRLLHGLLRPTSGEVRCDGRPLDRTARLAQAMVFQKPVLLRRSVAANLRFALGLRGKRRNDERLAELLARLRLDGLADRPARALSGGEQQRLAVARALALDPELLMLDEPCANLDPASVLMIEDTIRTVRAAGKTVLLVTHDIHQAKRLAEEVVFLHRGRIVESGPAERFFQRPNSAEARAYLAGEILI